jgi:hypothetical protein
MHQILPKIADFSTDDEAVIILRCQECEDLTEYFASAPVIDLTAVLSASLPEFLNADHTLADLLLAGAALDPFTLDTQAAQFANYTEMVSSAGLE